jgi:NADH-quinone oxidoreductase subunit L
MLEILWLVPALPFVGFLCLLFLGSRCTRQIAATIGTAPVALSAVLASLMAVEFVVYPPKAHAYVQTLWTWVSVAGFNPAVSLYLDPLSMVMVLVVSWVGFLIFLYSTWFMAGDGGYCRFFAYMNQVE